MKIAKLLLIPFLVLFIGANTASAQLTILPYTETSVEDCERLINAFELAGGLSSQTTSNGTTTYTEILNRDQLLGCGIKTGRISLAMAPYYVTYITNFMLALVGIIVVLFVVIGGYYYIYGGLAEQKEKGKNVLVNALTGLGVASLAWVIVNLVMALVTG